MGLALAAVLGGTATAQERPRREIPAPQEFVGSQDDSLFSIARSQENVFEWEQARSELDAGNLRTAVERLHKLLREEVGGVVQVESGRYLGLRQAVLLTLANLSPAAEQEYEELARREAGSLQDRPLHELLPEQLAMLADRFPAASIGRRARLHLGDLALAAGDGLTAVAHFRAAHDAARIGSRLETAIEERLLVADALNRPRFYRDQESPPAPVAAALAVQPEAADPSEWPAVGGGYGGAQRMTDPVGDPQLRLSEEIVAEGFQYSPAGTFAMHAVGDQSAIYVNNGLELLAFDPLRGDQVAWVSPSPLRDHASARERREYMESTNQDMVLAPAFAGDVVVAALQVPDDSATINFQGTFSIMKRLPERRLYAFQRSTGKLLWSHYDQLDGPVSRRFRTHLASGPPLVLGDTVYAPVHDRSGAIAFYLGAYDLWTGQPKWRRLICSSQQEVNMFGNARQEFASSPLCAHDGVIYGVSNLGVAYAVEMATGRLRWVSAYEVISMPPTALHRQSVRPIYFQNSTPLVTDGVLCATPLDSAHVLAFDCQSGKSLWRMEARARGNADVRWLFGAVDGEFLLAGKAVVAVRARAEDGRPEVRLVRGAEQLALDPRGEIPRPVLSESKHVWIAGPGRVNVFDTQGVVPVSAPSLRLVAPGNLLLVDGMVAAISNRSFEVHFDPAALRSVTERRLRDAPDDPAAILRLCALREAMLSPEDAQGARALEELYQRGLQACIAQGLPPEDRLRATFQLQVFDAALRRAMRTEGAAAVTALRAARDLAPDTNGFLDAQSRLLEQLDGDARELRRELDVLAERAGEASYPLPGAGGSVPVPVYVLWRKARLLEDPAARALAWQELLERHGDATIARSSVRDLAWVAIRELIERHGAAVYAPIEARAATELERAGNDLTQLRSLVQRFPHSKAAARAGARLLDVAAAAGDLASTIELLAAVPMDAAPTPALLRRTLEAAKVRGNHALAEALARRLAAVGGDEASDWPADGGATWAAVGARIAASLTIAAPDRTPTVPAQIVDAIDNPPQARQLFRLLPVHVEAGFPPPPDVPLYVLAGENLRAIDLTAPGRPTLFSRQVGYCERVFVCGRVVVAFELTQIVALDYRSGIVLWSVPTNHYIEGLGLCEGVLLASLKGNDDQTASLIGIEPLTGRTLFQRSLPAGNGGSIPKPWQRGVLHLRTPPDGPITIDRLDPITGRTLASLPLGRDTLRALGLREDALRAASMFPKTLAADERFVFVPADNDLVEGQPRIGALRQDGSVAWTFAGTPGRRFLVHALRGSRLVVVEAGRPGQGRAVILDATTGQVQRELELGDDLQIHNWHNSWMNLEAPPALLGSDIDPQGDRRLVCIGIAEGMPTFVQPIGAAGEQLERWPHVSPDLLLYGVKSRQRNTPMRLYALRPADRSGALPDGDKYVRIAGTTYGMGTAGPYTVVVTENGLILLGDGRSAR